MTRERLWCGPGQAGLQVNNSHSDRIRTGSLYHIVDLSNIPGKDDEWIPMGIKALSLSQSLPE